MNNRRTLVKGLLVASGLALCAGAFVWRYEAPKVASASRDAGAELAAAMETARLERLPLSFAANRGQLDGEVQFASRGAGYGLFLGKERAVFAVAKPGDGRKDRPTTISMRLADANPDAGAHGAEELPGKLNYFTGNNRAHWRTGVETFRQVRYTGVYPGIDMVYYGQEGRLEYDFIVEPGADPGKIELVFEGVRRTELDRSGDLVLHAAEGSLRQRKPVAYQEVGGSRREVASNYAILGESDGSVRVAFELGDYDRRERLVIDPVLIYSTYFGGDGPGGYAYDHGRSIGVDSAGNIYLCGYTFSLAFPTTAGSYDTTQNGGGFADVYGDAFVVKLNPEGNTLLYGTYLGGGRGDGAEKIVVDADGYAYVAGRTYGNNYPVTAGSFQPNFNNPIYSTLPDGFVTKLNPNGSSLVYSTYVGGNNEEAIRDLAVDSQGRACVTGYTRSTNFPVTANGYTQTIGVDLQAFVASLSPDGSQLYYGSLFGGSEADQGFGVAVDAQDRIYVAGWTYSANLPIKAAPASTAHWGSSDGFVASFDPTAVTPDDSLVFSARMGGDRDDRAQSVEVDGSGNVYVAGYTFSSNFPTVNAFQPKPGVKTANRDAFLIKYDSTVSTILYSTYLGATGNDAPNDLCVDAYGGAYLVGSTSSSAWFPMVSPFQSLYGGGTLDGFIAKFDTRLAGRKSLAYCSYLGGISTDEPFGLVLAPDRTLYAAGTTRSPNFPRVQAYSNSMLGEQDAFICRIGERRRRARR
jgi:hypothetical protein